MKHALLLLLLANVGACVGEPAAEEPSSDSAAETVVSLPVGGKADSLGTASAEKGPCAEDLDCPIGQACHEGECFVASCRSWAGCASHEVCVDNHCTVAVCDTESCSAGESCIAGKCVDAAGTCIDSLDCIEGQTCILSTCADPRCASDADCHDSVCVGGACRRLGCASDRDCAGAEVCRDQRCTVATD